MFIRAHHKNQVQGLPLLSLPLHAEQDKEAYNIPFYPISATASLNEAREGNFKVSAPLVGEG